MHLVISTGMSIEEVETQFDIPRLLVFNKYCEKFPPQHVLIAAYFGFGAGKKEEGQNKSEHSSAENEASFAEFMTMLQQR